MITEQIRARLKEQILDWYEHNPKRTYISIAPKDIKLVADYLFKELGLRFATASGQDTPSGLEILYHFSFDKEGVVVSLRVLLKDKNNPQIDSLATLFPAAEWIEREMWELLGINFVGHPNLTRLLLAEEWPEGKYPLRHEHSEEEGHGHTH
ncbi:MAG: NADH-quinone oxidoreductase subunit C [Candidatus Omnitrophota bacterium]|jgi:Ni,Fe-hydrogenase III component G|nr:MAG: NADH-quinone oxidoreductase subunit C [Candidatus Omnitrophota bacterium]